MATVFVDFADPLPPELPDLIEFIGVGDYVRVTPFYAGCMAGVQHYYGTIERINERVQYAYVEVEGRANHREWFSIAEIELVLKQAALNVAPVARALSSAH